jgi:hypothetical protein
MNALPWGCRQKSPGVSLLGDAVMRSVSDNAALVDDPHAFSANNHITHDSTLK